MCLRLSLFNLNGNILALKVLLFRKSSWMWEKELFSYEDVSYERKLRCEVAGGVKHENCSLILRSGILSSDLKYTEILILEFCDFSYCLHAVLRQNKHGQVSYF